MLERNEYMPLEYFKKQRWTGSYRGLRFLFQKIVERVEEVDNDQEKETEQVWLEVVAWKEPYSYEATPEEEKTKERFAFTEEGREAAIEWLEQEYENHQRR